VMTTLLLFLLATVLLTVVLLGLAGISLCWDAWQMRREAKRRAITRHPATRARAMRRRRAPGGPHDGEPLSEDDLNEFTGIMFASGFDGWQEDQAQETGAGEETE
jgi:hypothetical protein